MPHLMPDDYGHVVGITGKLEEPFKEYDLAVWQAESVNGRILYQLELPAQSAKIILLPDPGQV